MTKQSRIPVIGYDRPNWMQSGIHQQVEFRTDGDRLALRKCGCGQIFAGEVQAYHVGGAIVDEFGAWAQLITHVNSYKQLDPPT